MQVLVVVLQCLSTYYGSSAGLVDFVRRTTAAAARTAGIHRTADFGTIRRQRQQAALSQVTHLGRHATR
jgi:hypothetical protein